MFILETKATSGTNKCSCGRQTPALRSRDAVYLTARGHMRRPRLLLVSAVGITATVDASEAAEDLLARYTSLSSCGELHGHPSGNYRVAGRAALCDQWTDGGGWTLVSSSRAPPSDFGGAWYEDLLTLQPTSASHPQLWFSRWLSAPVSDFRFSCATRRCEAFNNCSFAVDMVFYENPWYHWIASTRFSEWSNTRRCARAHRFIILFLC